MKNNSKSNPKSNPSKSPHTSSKDASKTGTSVDASPIVRAYLLPGMPQPLLTPEANSGYAQLRAAYEQVRKEIEATEADVILIYSEMWTSVIGHQIQAMAEPTWVHVDEEFHDLGSIPYKFRMDVDLAASYNLAAQNLGLHARTVAYEGFPIDTGTIVALKLINPDNRLPAVILSSNIYADRTETGCLAQAGLTALRAQGKKAIAIIISNLSKNMHLDFVDPARDHIFASEDDLRNRELLNLLEAGRLDEFVHCEHYNLRPFWWMEALIAAENHMMAGQTLHYAPVCGSGCAVVSMAPALTSEIGKGNNTSLEVRSKDMSAGKPADKPADKPANTTLITPGLADLDMI